LRNMVVRIPGPSSMANLLTSKTTPFVLATPTRYNLHLVLARNLDKNLLSDYLLFL